MNFKAGVLIIGSLIWEKTDIRTKWRKVSFQNLTSSKQVPTRIRYGRESRTRSNTYSMIFNNDQQTKPGQGLLLQYMEVIRNFSNLQSNAYALAVAEGICSDLSHATLNSNWGSVGLLIKPSLIEENSEGIQIVITRWQSLYKEYKSFNHTHYKVGDELPVIDQNGFLQLEWQSEFNHLDLILATPVVPAPRCLLQPHEIAQRMKEKNYFDYFQNNRANGILTFQDEQILEVLQTK
jgi:hypothetical protein